MRNDTHRYLVAYDIPDDRRRTRVAKCLSSYGDRLQYSVFVVDAGKAKFIRMKDAIETLLDTGQDSVLFCDLGRLASVDDNSFTVIGRQRPITDGTTIIV